MIIEKRTNKNGFIYYVRKLGDTGKVAKISRAMIAAQIEMGTPTIIMEAS